VDAAEAEQAHTGVVGDTSAARDDHACLLRRCRTRGVANGPRGRRPFATIQRTILDVSCTSCHRTGDANARQSGLVLTADSSYQQLVGMRPTLPAARADGLLRIRAFKRDSSLLSHKLSWVPGPHSGDYGQLMPMGTTHGITAGQLEYVRRWIEAGALRAGHVVDTMVLQDSREQTASFTPLSAPAVGIQPEVDSFSVVPNFERELFVYRRLGNASEIYITRIQSRMRPGSHHLLLYTFDEARTGFPCNTRPVPNQVRDIRNPDGSLNLRNLLPMACHVFFAGATGGRSVRESLHGRSCGGADGRKDAALRQ
jgi:hypothetical protein